jgi:hypothetical protein
MRSDGAACHRAGRRAIPVPEVCAGWSHVAGAQSRGNGLAALEAAWSKLMPAMARLTLPQWTTNRGDAETRVAPTPRCDASAECNHLGKIWPAWRITAGAAAAAFSRTSCRVRRLRFVPVPGQKLIGASFTGAEESGWPRSGRLTRQVKRVDGGWRR